MSDQQPVDPVSDPQAHAAIFLAMMDDLGVGRTNDLPLSGGGPLHNPNLPIPTPSRSGNIHSGVNAWNTAVFEADTVADEGKDSIMDGQLHRANRMAAQGQFNQPPVQRGTGSYRGGRGAYGIGRNNMLSRGAIDHANITQSRRANETNIRVVQLIERLDKKSANSVQGPMTHAPKVTPPPKAPRANRLQPHRREIFGRVMNLAPPDVIMESVPKVCGRPSAAAPNNDEAAIKTETPLTIKDEGLINAKPDALIPVKENLAVQVKEESIVGVKEKISADPATVISSVVGQQPFKGLSASKYVTKEYLEYLATQKAAHEALAQSSIIADAAKAEASNQSSAPQLQGTSTVKPVVILPKEYDYDNKLTRKWGGKFSMNGSLIQDATIIYFAKEERGPRTLRLVVSVDGKPVSVFSQVVPKDVPVKRHGGTFVDIGPFIEKGVEACKLKLQISPPSNMNAFLLAINPDPFRPEKSRVEPEITERLSAETGPSPQATASMGTSVSNEQEADGSNADQEGEQVQVPKIFDSCFEQAGVAWLFASAVENQYEGTFLEYMFKTFNNSSLQVNDAKEAILESVELVAGADQMIHDFTRSSPTFMMMSQIGASGPPPGFGKKVLAEVLAIRDAIDARNLEAALLDVDQPSASYVKSQASIIEQPTLEEEPPPKRTSYAAEDLLELRDDAVEYEQDLLPSTEMRSPNQRCYGHSRGESIAKPVTSPSFATTPSTSVAGWNSFATTAAPQPASSLYPMAVRLPTLDLPSEPLSFATTAGPHPAPIPHPTVVRLPTPETPSVSSKSVSLPVPKPAPSQGHDGNVFSPKPSGNITQAPVSLAQIGTHAQGPKPNTLSNNLALAAKYSEADTDLEDMITSCVKNMEDHEADSALAKLAKLPGLGTSRFGPNGDKGRKPQSTQPHSPAVPQPKTPAQVDSKLQEQLELARQLRGEFSSGGKSAKSTSKAASYSIPKQVLRNGPEQMGGKPVNSDNPSQQQPAAHAFPPRADMDSRKESSTDSSDTNASPRRRPHTNTQVNAQPINQRQVFQAQNRIHLQSRR